MSWLISKPEECALRFGDCTQNCVSLVGADDWLPCYCYSVISRHFFSKAHRDALKGGPVLLSNSQAGSDSPIQDFPVSDKNECWASENLRTFGRTPTFGKGSFWSKRSTILPNIRQFYRTFGNFGINSAPAGGRARPSSCTFNAKIA